ncbi:hypothetical protein [Flavobacterium aquidurense]|uniref:hypothetical protein n=1 Tax=Flavobacterium aquidurense TaxID=362413 RepID=UPI00285E7A72|nr:hypothetical protein [Flavobacterium aquidurense]MDR7370284.1 thymidylate kinase [Flavobacterium aquidurense]
MSNDAIADYFYRRELDELLKFIQSNKTNFPGSYFIEEAAKEKFYTSSLNELSKSLMPLYFILSRKEYNNWDKHICNVMNIVLMDENYDSIIPYDLNFDIIGKIEIYKQA